MLGNLVSVSMSAFLGFSSILGEPVQIALTLDIASISSISESNMVSVAPAPATRRVPLLVCNGDTGTQNGLMALLHLEWHKVET